MVGPDGTTVFVEIVGADVGEAFSGKPEWHISYAIRPLCPCSPCLRVDCIDPYEKPEMCQLIGARFVCPYPGWEGFCPFESTPDRWHCRGEAR